MANRLQFSSSPYLLQHAHNPVDWYPWGEEAFQKAHKEQRPLLVSIGYAACHWCHVMEKESFEDEHTAQLMNDNFVCIKVDREEHPEVDHFFMDAVVAMTGSGGWPLNVFATPERIPFYGGTYFPPVPIYQRASWSQVLQSVAEFWKSKPDDVQLQAHQLHQHLKQLSSLGKSGVQELFSKQDIFSISEVLMHNADVEYGGFGGAPKFPGTFNIGYMLANHRLEEKAFQHALFSLDKLITSGIYDYIGGGLSRYATDREWMIPHFEKMLYDQALLLEVLAIAYRKTGESLYKEVIYDVVLFCEQELQSGEGLFYCSLDADSEGEEGKFYTWTYEEWMRISKGEWPAAERFLHLLPDGNWEGTNILHRSESLEEISVALCLSKEEVSDQISNAYSALKKHRAYRVRPQTDDKCLLSWNALMNVALLHCGAFLDDKSLTQKATKHFEQLLRLYRQNGRFFHNYHRQTASISSTLEDLSLLLRCMWQQAMYQGDDSLYQQAHDLMLHIIDHYSDEQQLFFYYTSKEHPYVPVRKLEINDTALPSVNAVMAENLMWMGLLLGKYEWLERSRSMCAHLKKVILQYPSAFGFWATQASIHARVPALLIVPDASSKQEVQKYLPLSVRVVLQHQLPSSFIATTSIGTEKRYQLCTSGACLAIQNNISDILRAIERL